MKKLLFVLTLFLAGHVPAGELITVYDHCENGNIDACLEIINDVNESDRSYYEEWCMRGDAYKCAELITLRDWRYAIPFIDTGICGTKMYMEDFTPSRCSE